jgi:iron complex outermembrane receptor protein
MERASGEQGEVGMAKMTAGMFRQATGVSLIALMMGGAALPAQAQQIANPEDDANTIVVTGFRASLEDARRAKLESNQIIDGISAEDIGQFPDENVAESLARVTGIQIDRSQTAYGEGSFISIRGLGPDATRTFVNGRAVLSTKFADRSVDFRDMPADFVQALQVIKSPEAANIEGSLGGVVNVVTRKPLDGGGGFKAAVSVQGVYADLNKELDPMVGALYSNSWADNTIGITLTGQYQRRDNRQDSFVSNGYDCRNSSNLGANIACDSPNAAYLPRASRYQLERVPSERIGIGGTIQWRPNDNWEITADGLWNQRKETQDQISLVALTAAGSIVPGTAVLGADRSVVAFEQSTATIRVINLHNTAKARAFNGGINARYTADRLIVEGDFGYSKSKVTGDFDQGIIDNRTLGGFSVDFRTPSGVPAMDYGAFNDAPLATAGYFPFQVRRSKVKNDQEDKQYRLSATIGLDDDFKNSFEFGMRYSDASYFAGVFGARARSNFFNVPSGQQVPFTNPGQFITTADQLYGIDDFGRQLPGFQTGNFVIPILSALQDTYLPANFDFRRNVLDTALIEEEVLSGYGQFNFTGERFAGNIGVRVIRTKLRSSGEVIAGQTSTADLFTGEGVTILPISLSQQYTDVLPSANFKFDVIPDRLIARVAAYRSIYRPEPDELATRGSLNINTLQLTTGNPNLDPFRATNFDVSLEYYFGRDGLISAALFHKDIESFISTNVPTGATFDSDGIIYTVVGPANGEGGKLTGLELGMQMSFADLLPAPFDGFGIVANYTFIDDKTKNVINRTTNEAVGLPGVSRHSYNLIGFYEKGPFSARLAYNWRSSFLQGDRNAGALNLFTDDYGALDGRVAVQVTDFAEIYVEAKNITNAAVRGYAESKDRLVEYYNFGRRFFFGAQMTF